MYHIFIPSSVDGHLGCFQALAIVNGAAVHAGVLLFFCCFSLGICQGVELLEHLVIRNLNQARCRPSNLEISL